MILYLSFRLKDLKELFQIRQYNQAHLNREMAALLEPELSRLSLMANHRYHLNLKKRSQEQLQELKNKRSFLENEAANTLTYKESLKKIIEDRKKTLQDLKERSKDYREALDTKRAEIHETRLTKIRQFEEYTQLPHYS